MDGIMVLHSFTKPIYSFGWNNWCLLFILPIIFSIYLIFFWWANRDKVNTIIWGRVGVITLITCITLGTMICSTNNVKHERYYQVLVDNFVDMEEFRQNYEIIEQVGITYIIQQK